MTTELTVLLAITVMLLVGAFVGPNSPPRSAFVNSGPALGARIERQLDTGAGFQQKANQSYKPLNWESRRGQFE